MRHGLPFPRTMTIGDVYIDDLVVLSVSQFSDVHVESPIEVQRADALYDFLQMHTNANNSDNTLGRVLERTPRRRCKHSWIPSRTASFAHAHHDAGRCYRCKSDTPSTPRRVGIRLDFRREALTCLEVSSAAAASLAPSRRPVHGALLEELLLVTGLAPLLQTNLRSESSQKLYATDDTKDDDGGCAESITQEDWLPLCDLAEAKGEHVRLQGKGEEPPIRMHDGRAAAAPLAMKSNWTTMFSYRFSQGQAHEPPGTGELDQLLRRITREGVRARRLLVPVDSRVVSSAVSKRRSSSRKVNFLLRKLGFSGCVLPVTLRWN